MKFLSIFFVFSSAIFACKLDNKTAAATATDGSVAPQTPTMPSTTLAFENDTWDFGKIKEGTIVEHTYVVKNTGKEPLLITNCKASCGCTIPDWPKDPIQPGETGKIDVKFNSTHKAGDVSKAITVSANTVPEQNFITLKGVVIGDENK